jgi:hypothetical protein
MKAAKCLETRRTGQLAMRRYLKANGRRVKTMELPWSLWLRVRPSVLRGLPGFEKSEAARDRIAEIQHLLRGGNKSEWIAEVTGVTPQRVRQIKARMSA